MSGKEQQLVTSAAQHNKQTAALEAQFQESERARFKAEEQVGRKGESRGEGEED
jgi:hypothetical protein